MRSRVLEIAKNVGLTDGETDFLGFLIILRNPVFNKQMTLMVSDYTSFRTNLSLISKLSRVAEKDLSQILKSKSTLFKANIVVSDKDTLSICDGIKAFLDGFEDEDFSKSLFISKDPGPISTEDFSVPYENINIMKNLLSSNDPCSILLYGAPGTGKTELSLVLARESGSKSILIKQSGSEGEEDFSRRIVALCSAQNIFSKSNGKFLIVVDECDQIINSVSNIFSSGGPTGDRKSWINEYIETNKIKMVWIANDISRLDESTKRRFSYSQEFKELNQKQRAKAWKIQSDLQNNTFLTDSIIDDLSKKYTVSPGILSLALKNTLSFGGIGAEKQFSVLNNILEQQQKLCMGTNSELAPIRSGYSLEGINADHSMDKIVNSSKIFFSRNTDKNVNREVINLNILLSGPPGTGKTEFAKYLSEQTGREILVKRASDILDKYVGGTEKNISRIFSEAEESNSILFLDEADSLFINRENAKESWESSQTNELLCQMENFKGLLICATNFASNMDPAIMRRFTYKVKFDYLKPESNRIFFDKILAPISNGDLSEVENSRLSKISKLTPGDFKAVYQKFAFEEKVEPKELVDALTVEIEYRKKTTGSQIKSLGM